MYECTKMYATCNIYEFSVKDSPSLKSKKKGESRYNGLEASSNIQLIAPLTKEEILTNNGGGSNRGGSSTIKQVSK